MKIFFNFWRYSISWNTKWLFQNMFLLCLPYWTLLLWLRWLKKKRLGYFFHSVKCARRACERICCFFFPFSFFFLYFSILYRKKNVEKSLAKGPPRTNTAHKSYNLFSFSFSLDCSYNNLLINEQILTYRKSAIDNWQLFGNDQDPDTRWHLDFEAVTQMYYIINNVTISLLAYQA